MGSFVKERRPPSLLHGELPRGAAPPPPRQERHGCLHTYWRGRRDTARGRGCRGKKSRRPAGERLVILVVGAVRRGSAVVDIPDVVPEAHWEALLVQRVVTGRKPGQDGDRHKAGLSKLRVAHGALMHEGPCYLLFLDLVSICGKWAAELAQDVENGDPPRSGRRGFEGGEAHDLRPVADVVAASRTPPELLDRVPPTVCGRAAAASRGRLLNFEVHVHELDTVVEGKEAQPQRAKGASVSLLLWRSRGAAHASHEPVEVRAALPAQQADKELAHHPSDQSSSGKVMVSSERPLDAVHKVVRACNALARGVPVRAVEQGGRSRRDGHEGRTEKSSRAREEAPGF
mmetsp:Transcript_49458/g.165136  ORF Transcript_49458/g.165136 Transcript_49458/m.165136 type:complete len:344 (-) Transcript_49458:68-1099(-)